MKDDRARSAWWSEARRGDSARDEPFEVVRPFVFKGRMNQASLPQPRR